jgi:hypothetical protein
MASWSGGSWNMVLVGNTNAPETHCGAQGGTQFTKIDSTPIIAEKPYIVKSDVGYSLMVPRLEKDKYGPTNGW